VLLPSAYVDKSYHLAPTPPRKVWKLSKTPRIKGNLFGMFCNLRSHTGDTMPKAKERPMSIYPGETVKRAVADISKADHDRPHSHVVELAIKAFAVLWKRDRYEALKLADAFDSSRTN
jgi:hypothetical protein